MLHLLSENKLSSGQKSEVDFKLMQQILLQLQVVKEELVKSTFAVNLAVAMSSIRKKSWYFRCGYLWSKHSKNDGYFWKTYKQMKIKN